MDSYLYGLLGLSLAANAFSFINGMIAKSKQRDEENQRTISSIYDELNRKIEDTQDHVERIINERDNALKDRINDTYRGLSSRIDWMDSEISRISEESEPEFCTASKKKSR